MRVGIDTGLVVVGDVGAGRSQEQLALGDTPNLAARLQALASYGAVVLSDGTRRLLAGSFALRDLGLQPLKGIAEPVHAWHALSERKAESRFEAANEGRLAPMVGRELEFSVVLHAWQRARMIFIRADGTIARIAAETVPYSLEPVDSGEPVAAVLELAGGKAAALGIAEDDVVRWEDK